MVLSCVWDGVVSGAGEGVSTRFVLVIFQRVGGCRGLLKVMTKCETTLFARVFLARL